MTGMELMALVNAVVSVGNLVSGVAGQQAQRNVAEEGLAQQQKLGNLGFAQNLMQQGQGQREKALDQMMNQYRAMLQPGMFSKNMYGQR
jgi:hypothetical protein